MILSHRGNLWPILPRKTVFGAAVFVGGLLWAAHHELGSIGDRISAVDKHISRVETAVRIVGAKQGGDTKALIDEALAVAKNAQEVGRTESAKTVLKIANDLLSQQASARVEAPPEFFDRTISQYQKLKQSPALADSA